MNASDPQRCRFDAFILLPPTPPLRRNCAAATTRFLPRQIRPPIQRHGASKLPSRVRLYAGQQGAKKALGGNRRAPAFGIKGIEARRHRMQNHIGHHFDPAQRVIRGNPVFDMGVAEKAALLMVMSLYTTHSISLRSA